MLYKFKQIYLVLNKYIFSYLGSIINDIFGPAILFLDKVDKDNKLLKRFIFVIINIVFLETLIVPLFGIGFDFIINPKNGISFLDFKINTDLYFFIVLAYIILRVISFKKLYSEKYKFAIRLPYDFTIKSAVAISKLRNKFRNKIKQNDLSRVITTETENVVWRYMVQLIDAITEFIVFVLLIILLSKLNFYLGIFLIIFSFIYILNRLISISKLTENINESKVREDISRDSEILQKGLISLLPTLDSNWLSNNLKRKFRKLEYDQTKLILIPIFQKVKVEVFLLLSISLLAFLLYKNLISFSSNIGIIVFSIYRILLSIGRITSLLLSIFASKNSVKYYISFLKYPFLGKSIKSSSKRKLIQKQKRIIQWDEFKFEVSNNRYTIVPSLSIGFGEICVFSGKSGIGKTTLLKNIFKWDNKLRNKIKNPFMEDEIIYIPQESFIFRSSLTDNILLSKTNNENINSRIFQELLNIGLSEKRISDLLLMEDITDNISGGEAHRICLLRVLFSRNYSNISVILLDEPTSSLDPFSAHKTVEWITKLNGIKFIVSHNPRQFKRFNNSKFLNLESFQDQ